MFGVCTCGHAIEEHGGDPEYPGSMACTECDCIHYAEADEEVEDGAIEVPMPRQQTRCSK